MMKSSVLLVILVVLCLSIFAETLWEQPTVVRNSVNIDWNRCASVTNGNAAIYCWSQLDDGDRNIYAQKVDGQGNPLWARPLVVDNKPGLQEMPVITKTSYGNFIIAWQDFSEGSYGNFYAQKIDSNGNLIWQTGGVEICHLPIAPYVEAHDMSIIPDSNGGAYVAWIDHRNPSRDIYGQHISSGGVMLWATNGIPLANSIDRDEGDISLLTDPAGGFLLSYSTDQSGTDALFAKHFNDSGTMDWDSPVTLDCQGQFSRPLNSAFLNPTTVVITWADNGENTNLDIKAQCIQTDGTVLWPSAFTVFSDASSATPADQRNPIIAGCGNNTVVIVWEDWRNNPDYSDLYAQKLNVAGERLWNSEGLAVCLSEYQQGKVSLRASNTGRCYIIWQDSRNSDNANSGCDIYAQSLNSDGTAIWESNGRPVCSSAYDQLSPIGLYINNQIYIAWEDYRLGSKGIYLQVFSQSGTMQVGDDRQQLCWGVSGEVDHGSAINLPLPDGTGVVWSDRRANAFQLYYQMVDTEGNSSLEQDGRSVTFYTGFDQTEASAVSTPDGKVAIAWRENRDGSPRIYAQLFDANGLRMWGDNGVAVTQALPLQQRTPSISYENGAFYIVWAETVTFVTPQGELNLMRIFGQKMINGQKQWGNNGIIISNTPDNNVSYECSNPQLIGRYVIWDRIDCGNEINRQNVWVRLLSEDGTSPEGWAFSGMAVTTYNDPMDNYQYSPKAGMSDAGLFIIWQDLRNEWIVSHYGQLISPSGQRLWDAAGVCMVQTNSEQGLSSLVTSNDGVWFTWANDVYSEHSTIMMQGYSLSGNPLWALPGSIIRQDFDIVDINHLGKFENGGFVTSWNEYDDNYTVKNCFRYVNPEGTPLGEPAGSHLGNPQNEQRSLNTLTVDNEAYLCWSEFNRHKVYSSEGGYNDYMGLYLQKINNEVVAGEDEIDTPAMLSLGQNYPNPFNPVTNISFSLKSAAEVELKVYNLKGQKVKTLHQGQQEKGQHNLTWNGMDDHNQPVASGVYMYRLSSGNINLTRKMILIK